MIDPAFGAPPSRGVGGVPGSGVQGFPSRARVRWRGFWRGFGGVYAGNPAHVRTLFGDTPLRLGPFRLETPLRSGPFRSVTPLRSGPFSSAQVPRLLEAHTRRRALAQIARGRGAAAGQVPALAVAGAELKGRAESASRRRVLASGSCDLARRRRRRARPRRRRAERCARGGRCCSPGPRRDRGRRSTARRPTPDSSARAASVASSSRAGPRARLRLSTRSSRRALISPSHHGPDCANRTVSVVD